MEEDPKLNCKQYYTNLSN